jgi:glucose uptake protein GlcU
MNIKEKYNTLSAKTRAAIKTAAIMTFTFGVPTVIVAIPQIMLPILFFSLIAGATWAIYNLVLDDIKYNDRYK